MDQAREGARGAAGATGAGGATGGAPATGAAGAQGPGRGRGGFVRRPMTDEDRSARYERACAGAPPETLVFTVDGATVFTYAVRGTTDCEYSRGENVVRMKLTAGDHVLRASFPGLANMSDVRTNFNPDGRRRLYVDYMDVLGVFNPSTAPPPGFRKIFICGEPGKYSPECARRIVDNLATRAYRRPATPQEVERLMNLVNEVLRRDSFEEGIRIGDPGRADVAELSVPHRARSSLRQGYGGQARRSCERVSHQRLRAGVEALLLPLEQHAGRRAVRGRREEAAARPRGARRAGEAHARGPEGRGAGEEFRRAVAQPAADGSQEAGRREIPAGG